MSDLLRNKAFLFDFRLFSISFLLCIFSPTLSLCLFPALHSPGMKHYFYASSPAIIGKKKRTFTLLKMSVGLNNTHMAFHNPDPLKKNKREGGENKLQNWWRHRVSVVKRLRRERRGQEGWRERRGTASRSLRGEV